MPLRIDSKAAIMAMIEDPDTFPTVIVALNKEIPKYLSAHLKDKGMGIDRLRATYGALGEDNFVLIMESLDEKMIASLLKKVDQHKTAGELATDLEHLKELASGRAAPTPKPEKAKKATAPRPRAPLTRAGGDKAASAKGTGTRPIATDGPDIGAPAKRPRGTKKASSDGH